MSLMWSCNCEREYHGLVFDQVTRQPLDYVTISNVHYPAKDHPDFSIVTDSTGVFSFSSGKRGIIGCRKEMIQFQKEGYMSFQTGEQENLDTVWMQKIESVY